MDTAQLEEKLYSTFINDNALMELLNNSGSSIFRLQAPSVYPDYPILVYSVISDDPILHADNLEILHSVTIRVYIINGENDYAPLYNAVQRIMRELDFTRILSRPFVDSDGTNMFITDWKIVLGA